MSTTRDLGAGTAPAWSNNNITVCVIIPTYNSARFLAEAISSVLAQTRPADEIIVVDDGSNDDPASVVAQFPTVRLIRQENRGPSSARNTGFRDSQARYIIFLDADDRLLPIAIEAGLRCIAVRPDCGFVYGGHRYISELGEPISHDNAKPIEGDPHLALLRENRIAMHATVLYRRDCLLAVDGFDETFRRAEDYDLYLRIAQRYPIASHTEIVAEYRQHGQNNSSDLKKMYLAGRAVLDRHKTRIAADTKALAVLGERLTTRRHEYARRAFGLASIKWRGHHRIGPVMRNLALAAQWSPFLTLHLLLIALRHRTINWIDRRLLVYLPDGMFILLRFILHHGYVPSLRSPKTFNEWVNSKVLFDRNPLMTLTADKYAVRSYVKERCGAKILVPLLQAADRAEEINFGKLPRQFVLKATHGSGLVEIVKDKSLINEDATRARLDAWLDVNFYEVHREWQYKDIPRRIIVEEALLDSRNQPPPDFKFYVFRGVVRMIHVDVGRFFEHRRSLFDREWRLLNVSYGYPVAGDQRKPHKLDEMIAIAEKLGKEFLFVRVDLYQYNNCAYFGEITHTPGAGLEIFSPQDFDRALGDLITTSAPFTARYWDRSDQRAASAKCTTSAL
jgi:glycosyltransferase involved in cell wall biosynthesis